MLPHQGYVGLDCYESKRACAVMVLDLGNPMYMCEDGFHEEKYRVHTLVLRKYFWHMSCKVVSIYFGGFISGGAILKTPQPLVV